MPETLTSGVQEKNIESPLGPMLGPSRPPTNTNQMHPGLEQQSRATEYYTSIPDSDVYNPTTHYEPVYDDDTEMLRIGHRKKEGEIIFKDIKQKDIVGDTFVQQQLRNVTKNDGIVSDSPYANLPSIINQGRGTGGRNIMQLAFEAKAKQAQLDEQRENSRAVRKMVRSKYGF